MNLNNPDSNSGSTPLTRPARLVILTIAAALVAGLLASSPFATSQRAIASDLAANDVVAPVPYQPSGAMESPSLLASSSDDPLGLIPFPEEVRRYTDGDDLFEVWQCPENGAVPVSASQFASDAEDLMTTYFSWLSNGQYDPDFIVGGVVPAGEDCSQWASDHATGSSAAALFVTAGTSGLGNPGVFCTDSAGSCPTTYPQNGREGFVGVDGGDPADWETLLAHEIGHMLSWPHSSTNGGETNNAIDVMSGNFGTWTIGQVTWWGTFPEPFGTTAFNRYQAGWIDPADVVVWDGSDTELDLNTLSENGTQMLVVDEGSSFYTFGARTVSSLDPIPAVWEGVEVYEITRCSACWGVQSDVSAVPPTSFAQSDLTAYSQPLDHVLTVGSSADISSAAVTVTQRVGDSFTVSVASSAFIDVSADNTFFADIEWLAAEGITKGCNPPANTKFCPDNLVTRAQMAAFLVRAIGYTDNGGGDLFTDDNNSIFENDIDKLGTAGVTKGCNPPANTKFCPDNFVTRAQMAAFLHRALG